MLTPITNHADLAVKRLITQYRESTNLQGLIRAFCAPIQEIENVLLQMETLCELATATGVNLDRLGTILGLARAPGESDAVYRAKLIAQVKINTSQGEPERVIEAFKTYTGANLILLTEHYPADITVSSDYLPPDQAAVDALLDIIESILPAGVRCAGIISFDATEAFAYAGDLAGLGYSSVAAPTVGGKYATIWLRDSFFAYEGNSTVDEGYGTIHDPLVGGRYAPI